MNSCNPPANGTIRPPITAKSLWKTFSVAVTLLLGTAGAVTAPARAQTQTPAIAADLEAKPTTKIIPGCVLGVTVTDETQLTGLYPVDAKGEIHFALADDDGGHKQEWAVSVKGKLTDEARTAIAESLKTYLVAPEVQVVIAKLPRVRVEISGPARTTGRFELSPNARLSDAMAACGYTPKADLANIRILRREAQDGKTPKTHTLAVNFTAFMRGESNDDPALLTGDKIILPALPEPTPEPKIARIVGEVEREASIPISPGMTLHDAFERAGGLKETANREKIRVVRGSDGRIFEVEADKVEANDPVHNLPLGPDDLIIVGMRDRSLRYAVLGEVMEQKTFDWDPKAKVTLLSALEQAGGLTKRGDARKGLLRKGYLLNPAQTRDLPFDLEQIIKGKQPDWEIEPGDAIFIPPKQRRPNILQQILPMVLRFLPFGL